MNKVGNDVKCANGINISLELPIFKQVVTMFCDVNSGLHAVYRQAEEL